MLLFPLLNKFGCLRVTLVLPKTIMCSSYQLSKQHRFSFDVNNKRYLHHLDLIHIDLWVPTLVTSFDSYRYYMVFIDDHSHFNRFYMLKTKSAFIYVFTVFMKFSRKIKTFQIEGGMEFVNKNIYALLEENDTFHGLSCPYTPQQNRRMKDMLNGNIVTLLKPNYLCF